MHGEFGDIVARCHASPDKDIKAKEKEAVDFAKVLDDALKDLRSWLVGIEMLGENLPADCKQMVAAAEKRQEDLTTLLSKGKEKSKKFRALLS